MTVQLAADAADDSRTHTLRRWIWLSVSVALALRVWEAAESSLWLDELHTLAHASLPNLSAVAAQVRAEVVHQPLFFLAVHLFGGWEAGASLRAIPVLSSLLLFVPLFLLARDSWGRSAACALTLWLAACLPYQVHWATELRPYAWLAVFSAGATFAAFSERGSRWSRLALFFVCVAAGIWTHRLMEFVVFSIGATRLIVRSREMIPLWWLIVAGAVAVAPEIVWLVEYAQKATEDRFEYQESQGGFRLRPRSSKKRSRCRCDCSRRSWAPSEECGRGSRAVEQQCSACASFGAVLNFLRRRRDFPPLSAPMRALFWFAVIDFSVVVALSFYRWDRLPLQYFAPVAWILPLAITACAVRWPERSRPVLFGILGASALMLGIAQAGGAGMEDMRGAVQRARAIGAELDRPIYSALLSQPDLFDETIPYRAYAPDLGALEPEDVPQPESADFTRPLVVLQRGTIPFDNPGWEPLLAGRRIARSERVDLYLVVHVLEAKP